MDKQSLVYRSSKSRLTPKQLEHNRINELIADLINTLSEPKDAEFLWLEFAKKGYKMSMSSFYGHLKKLVEAKLIVKIHIIHNKFNYHHP